MAIAMAASPWSTKAFWIAGQCGVVPLAISAPGQSKTACAQALAEATGRFFAGVILNHKLPEDFGGFPMLGDLYGQKTMFRAPDEFLVRCAHEPSILLIDELTNAAPAQQAAALELMQKGIPGCWIFAAANPEHLAASPVPLSPPMINRLCLLEWTPDIQAWLRGLEAGNEFEPPNIPVVPQTTEDERAQLLNLRKMWGALVADYCRVKPENANRPPKATEIDLLAKPFPSMRSWSNFVVCAAGSDAAGQSKFVTDALAHGCLGEAVASDFIHWRESLDLRDPHSILMNADKYKLRGKPAIDMVEVRQCLVHVINSQDEDMWHKMWQVAYVIHDQKPELAAIVAATLWGKKLPSWKLPTGKKFEALNNFLNLAT